MKFLTPIDLNSNELQNARLQSLGTDPGSPADGMIWLNTGSNRPKIRLSGVTFDFTDAYTLGGASLAQVRDFSQTTGTRTSAAISDFDTQVRLSTLTQLAAPTASVSFGSQKITNLAAGTNPADAVNFAQLEAARQGIIGKAAVDAVMTANVVVALPATAVFDGQTLATGEGLGLFGQTVASENGIYVFNGSASALTRRDDADAFGELDSGTETFSQGGTVNSGVWRQTAELTAFTGQTWIKVNGATTYLAGSGLVESPAGTFNVGGTASRISVSGDNIDIDAAYVGQASITTLGTIATGVWNGTAIAYSKLTLTGAILNADLAGSIAYSKLTLTGAILNADLAGSIAYSKLTLTGAILNADLAGSIAAAKLVGSDIATVGTITTGTWNATAIAVARGGTGGTTPATARSGIGATGKYSALIGDGSATTITITQATHGLAADGTNTVSLYDATTGAQVYPNVTVVPASGNVTLAFTVAPTTNQYRVVIVG